MPALGLSWVSTYSAHLALVCMFGLLTGIWIAATSPLLVRSVLSYLIQCLVFKRKKRPSHQVIAKDL